MAILITTSYQQISTISLDYGEIRTYAKYSSQSKENSTTTYQLKTTYYIPSQNYVSFSSATAELDGTTKNYGYTTMNKGETTIQELSRTANHSSDGTSPTKNVATSWTASFGGSGSTSVDIVFPKIDRYPMITSAPDFTDEENPTVAYTKTLGISGATVQIAISSLDSSVFYADYRNVNVSNGSYTFNLTSTERNALRQACTGNQMDVLFKLKTTSGTTYYFSNSQKKMRIVNANPTIGTVTFTETNSKIVSLLGSSANTLVKNASILSISIPFTTYKYATGKVLNIKEGTSSNVLQSYSHQNPTSPDTFSQIRVSGSANSGKFVFTITDSRNNTGTKTETSKTVLNYQPVAILNYSFERNSPTSSNIVLNLEATYYQQTFGSTANVPVVKWKLGSGAWNTISSSNYSINNTTHKLTITNYTLSNALVYTSEGRFTIYIEDKLTTAQDNNNGYVTKGIPTFDYGEHDLKVNGTLYIADEDGQNSSRVSAGWKYLGNKTGNASINLPATFNEICCDPRLNSSADYQILIIIPYSTLSTGARGFHGGYYYTSSNCGGARINASQTSASLNTAYQNGSSVLNNTITHYYYR